MDNRWKVILAFAAGAIFSEISADPTDYLFLRRIAQGTMSATEGWLYWYMLTASFYVVVFVAAYILSRSAIIKPEHFVYVLIFLLAWGTIQSYNVLTQQVSTAEAAIMISIPFAVSLGILIGLKEEVD